MRTSFFQRKMVIVLSALFGLTWLAHCTKEDPVNASRVSRALVEAPDSTVFSPFYDSTAIPKRDQAPDVNDYVKTTGVLGIVKSNCASANCHGGSIKPRLTTYDEIHSLVTPGNPEASKLFQLITTSDLNKAMPPISYGVDLSVTEKTKIYNWILHGAKDAPGLEDYRPAAIALIVNGCGSGNCHNQATVGGEWARRKLITFAPSDTTSFVYVNPGTGAVTIYAQLKEPKLSEVWNAYKDSVKKFYADTVANAKFRPYKTFSTPVVAANRRGPLNTYDDILMDVYYPKARRSNGSVTYVDPVTGLRYYVFSDHLNSTSSLISRIDSTLLLANPRTNVFATTHQGDMAYSDGGFAPSEIAIVKAWYFGDPAIPDVWKYGLTGSGIFKYRKTGNVIRK